MRAPANHKPRPCIDCGAEFKPGSGSAKRCNACKDAPKAKPCRTCGKPFEFGDSRAQYCPACRYVSRAKEMTKTCSNCQHGYEWAPGQWACTIAAARQCKPDLFARCWMFRQQARESA